MRGTWVPRKAGGVEMEARVTLEGTPLSHRLRFYLAHRTAADARGRRGVSTATWWPHLSLQL